jgi:hypothetical protein
MRTKISLCLIILLALPIIGYAQNPNNDIVYELYVKSGMEKQITQLPLIIQANFEQSALQDEHMRKMPKNVLLTISELAKGAFAPDGMKEIILQELRPNLSTSDIKQIFEWLDSSLGKRCTQLEEAASTPEGYSEMQKYAAGLQNSPPTPERLNYLRKFDAATKLTESAVDLSINTQIAVALAIVSTLPKERQRSLDDISREVEKMRAATEAAVRSHILVSLIYTYKSLTDAEIQQYTGFAASPAGTRYNSAELAAMRKAIYAGSVKWGKSIGEALKGMKSQTGA